MKKLNELGLMLAMAVISPIHAISIAIRDVRLARFNKDMRGITSHMLVLVVGLVVAAFLIAWAVSAQQSGTRQLNKLENKTNDLIDNLNF